MVKRIEWNRKAVLDLAYMVCVTPRTGSTSLMDCLRRTGVAGHIAEYPNAASQNGVYGVMVSMDVYPRPLPESFLPLARQYKYVYLYRENIIAQAISWEIARQTGRWQTTDELTENQPVYNDYQINKAIQRIYLDNYNWSIWLENKTPILRISYEELARDFTEGVRKILRFLGLPDVSVIPKLEKIGNDINNEWLEKWREGA